MKPLHFVPFVVILLIGLAFWWGNGREGQNELPSTMIGRDAPALQLEAMAGEPEFTREMLEAEGLKLVNFWASWCAPCRVEHPNLMALAEAGVPIYGINFKDDPVKAAEFLAELGNPYTAIGADVEGRSGFGWGAYGVPETFLIDGEGKILARVAGPVTTSTFNRDLGPALAAEGISVELGD